MLFVTMVVLSCDQFLSAQTPFYAVRLFLVFILLNTKLFANFKVPHC